MVPQFNYKMHVCLPEHTWVDPSHLKSSLPSFTLRRKQQQVEHRDDEVQMFTSPFHDCCKSKIVQLIFPPPEGRRTLHICHGRLSASSSLGDEKDPDHIQHVKRRGVKLYIYPPASSTPGCEIIHPQLSETEFKAHSVSFPLTSRTKHSCSLVNDS